MNRNQPFRYLTGIFLTASLSGLFGCSSTGGIITSLEDLTTESVKEGFFKIPQYRVASIPGWLPFADVGALYFYKPKRKPGSVIGLSPGSSFELVNEIPSDCDQKCLTGIRDNITNLGVIAQTLVQTRVDYSVLIERQSAKPADTSIQASADSANAKYLEAQTKFNESYVKTVNSIQNNGVLIYRWATDSSQSGSIGLDSLLGASAKENQKHNGFALVSGVRTKTLFVGDDLLTGWNRLDKESRFSERFELTTHLMQAKNIMYGSISDVSIYAQAKIEASYQQLANPADALKALTKIEIGLALSKVSNLSNIGVMGNIKRTVLPIGWDETTMKKRLADDNWLTFYSVESDFTDLLELLKGNK